MKCASSSGTHAHAHTEKHTHARIHTHTPPVKEPEAAVGAMAMEGRCLPSASGPEGGGAATVVSWL